MLLFSTINDIQLRFATPVLVKKWGKADEYNREFKSLLEKRRSGGDGVQLSNRGGWQSSDDLFQCQANPIEALSRFIENCITSIHHTYYQEEFSKFLEKNGGRLPHKLVGWANINAKGDWNSAHNHPNCHWSGCYYVQVPEHSGSISFFDPRPCVNMQDTGNPVLDLFAQVPQEVEPEAGMIVLFPSWMQHQVSTSESEAERISLAFNWRFL